jgi:hypothetical protein
LQFFGLTLSEAPLLAGDNGASAAGDFVAISKEQLDDGVVVLDSGRHDDFLR